MFSRQFAACKKSNMLIKNNFLKFCVVVQLAANLRGNSSRTTELIYVLYFVQRTLNKLIFYIPPKILKEYCVIQSVALVPYNLTDLCSLISQ